MVTQHDHDLEDPLKYADLRHVLARQQVVRDVELKTPEIKIGADMQRRQRDPAEQANGHQAEQSGENVCRLACERRRRQRDGERYKQQAKPRRPFGRGEDSAQEGLALAHESARQPEQGGMQQQRDDSRTNQDSGRQRPIRRRGQRHAESILYAFDRVLQHAAR